MAQAIYDYWFVQFDFPDENGKPYKSNGGKMVWNDQIQRKIPEGWKVISLEKLINPLSTGRLDANCATIDGKYPFFTCSKVPLKIDSFSYDASAIILAGNGEFYTFCYDGKFDVYQRDYVIIPKRPESKYYLYMTTNEHLRILKCNAQGSIIKFLTKGMVENIPVYSFDLERFRFEIKTINAIYKKIENNLAEIDKLCSLRDFLLPLLMNGQVTVTPRGEELNYDLFPLFLLAVA